MVDIHRPDPKERTFDLRGGHGHIQYESSRPAMVRDQSYERLLLTSSMVRVLCFVFSSRGNRRYGGVRVVIFSDL